MREISGFLVNVNNMPTLSLLRITVNSHLKAIVQLQLPRTIAQCNVPRIQEPTPGSSMIAPPHQHL